MFWEGLRIAGSFFRMQTHAVKWYYLSFLFENIENVLTGKKLGVTFTSKGR